MRIYTRTGDSGETGLIGGARVSKSSWQISMVGDLDEVNAAIGLVRAAGPDESMDAVLVKAQIVLFELGAAVASPLPSSAVDDELTHDLEAEMDQMDTDLAPLKRFILPGGCELAARLHLARVVCRRAERNVAAQKLDPVFLRYLNRLSDYLFVAARWANYAAGVRDIEWEGRRGDKR